jgi:hypothetical protein
MTRQQTTEKQTQSAALRPQPLPPVLWDRARRHQASLGHRIAQLRRTGHA